MNTAEKIAKLIELAPRIAAMHSRCKQLTLVYRAGIVVTVAAPSAFLAGFGASGFGLLSASAGLLGLYGWLGNRLDKEQDALLAELARFE